MADRELLDARVGFDPPSPGCHVVDEGGGGCCPQRPVIMMGMPTAEIYTLLLAGLVAAGLLWLVIRFNERD